MAAVEIDNETLELLDLRKSAKEEAESSSDLLPSTIVDEVVGARAEELGRSLAADLQHGWSMVQPEILAVPKQIRGRRPVAVLGPRDRVLYRGLCRSLGDEVPPPDRSSDAFERFKQSPLRADVRESCKFVLMSDVSSCYQYIDHEVLHREIITRTAEPFVAGAIVQFLQSVEGNSFGLPQNRASSHRLAELVLSIPERAMRRRGYETWRYSDDFRVGVPSRAEGFEALDDLSESLRLVGLTLNDEKTVLKSSADYEAWADALSVQLKEFVDEAAVDLSDFNYEGDLIQPDQTAVMAESAGRMVSHWVAGGEVHENQFGPSAVARRQMLNLAIGVLGAVEDERVLPLVPRILDTDPSMARRVSNYFEAMVEHDEDEFDRHFDQLLENSDLYLGSWQSLWLLAPLRRSTGLTSRQLTWCGRLVGGRSGYVAASASLALAAHHKADTDALISRFESFSPAAEALAVAALSLQSGGEATKRVAAVIDDDPLRRWIFHDAPGLSDDVHD